MNGKRHPPARPGDRVGSYTLEASLGEGGMGYVFRAVDAEGGSVAVKIVRPELAKGEEFRRRFRREVRAAARARHRHVVPVLDEGEHHGVPYLVQRFVGGGSLAERIETTGPLDVETTVRVCLEVAAGLDSLHEAGLVHRDVKPANILFDTEGAAHIADLGLVKEREGSLLTRPGQTVGSMDYMAPEQVRGEEVGPATDVYALGCVAYVCVAGKPPFAHRDGMKTLWAHLQEEPADPCKDTEGAPGDLGWAINRALEKDGERRPATATAYARMLQVAAGIASRTSP